MNSRAPVAFRLAAAVAALTACLLTGAARAGIAVSPLKQEITVKPGQPTPFKIHVSNTGRNVGDLPTSVRIEALDVAVTDHGGLEFKPPGTVPHSATKWISLGAEALTLQPGQTRDIECKITAPNTPGEFYSAVMITIDGRDDKAKNGVKVVHRIASGVFVTVAGRSPPKEAKIVRCEVVWPESANSATTQPEAAQAPKVAVLLKNSGQARFDATGKFSLVDARSRTVLAGPLLSARPCIFAGDSRWFEAALLHPLPAGRYQLRVECDYQSSWGKASAVKSLEIAPQQAELLKAYQKQAPADQPIHPVAQKLAAMMPPGAFRSLSLTLRNSSPDEARCEARLLAESERPVDASWVKIEEPQFAIAAGGARTLALTVQVAAGAAPGRYTSTLLVEAGSDRGQKIQIRTPLEIEVTGNAR